MEDEKCSADSRDSKQIDINMIDSANTHTLANAAAEQSSQVN